MISLFLQQAGETTKSLIYVVNEKIVLVVETMTSSIGCMGLVSDTKLAIFNQKTLIKRDTESAELLNLNFHVQAAIAYEISHSQEFAIRGWSVEQRLGEGL